MNGFLPVWATDLCGIVAFCVVCLLCAWPRQVSITEDVDVFHTGEFCFVKILGNHCIEM